MSLIISGLYGLLAIAMGAYAQHGLANSLTPEQVHALDTALRYQMYHAIMICILSLAKESTWRIAQFTSLTISCWLFILGTLVFSFSIQGSILLAKPEWIQWTPYGGSTLMLGWLMLVWLGWRIRK